MTAFTATVTVRLKRGVLDPEAETTQRSLERLGFDLNDLRSADVFELDLDADSADDAAERAEEMAERLLANPTIHDYDVEVTETDDQHLETDGKGLFPHEVGRVTIAVVQFGGSNCDRDAVRLWTLGFDAELVWHEDGLPEDVEGVVLPGGFSYGDYLRAGAMAARSPIMADVREVATRERRSSASATARRSAASHRLTPGAFTTNESARFQCEHVHLRVENADTPGPPVRGRRGRRTPDRPRRGPLEITAERLDELEAEDRILFQYCDEDGTVTPEANPNGSTHRWPATPARRTRRRPAPSGRATLRTSVGLTAAAF